MLVLITTVVLVTLLAWLLREQARADRLDGWWLQARFRLREMRQISSPDPDIVLVEIDDKSLEQWPEPQVLWGRHMAAAIGQLNRSGVRLIALDWSQLSTNSQIVTEKGPQADAIRQYFARYDAEFGQAISQSPDFVFVMWPKNNARTTADWQLPTPQLLYSRPDAFGRERELLGYATLSSPNSVVAAQAPAIPGDAPGVPDLAFAARIVERALKGKSELSAGQWRVWPANATQSTLRDPSPLRSVPLRVDGSVLINYRPHSGTARAFTRHSIFDVATGRIQALALKDKIVLIGTTFAGSNDSHFIPVLRSDSWSSPRVIPGVEVQANLVRTLLSASPIREPNSVGLWLLSCALGLTGALAFYGTRWARAVLIALGVLVLWIGASLWLFLAHNFALPVVLPLALLAMGSALVGGYRAFGEERERQQVLKLWGRYQDERLVDYLLLHPEARGGQGVEREVTVLFADLKNFTKTVEHLSPPEAIQMLNRYLELMTQVLRDEYGAVVEKYLGDGLMAQWGAPELYSVADGTMPLNHQEVAVRACLELERRTRELTESVRQGREVTFGIRLTLHTGPVVHGWVGDPKRIELTIIGDIVNVCARLQETAKQLDCEFLISETTFAAVRGWAQVGQEAEVEIRGRDQPLRVYEITGQRALENLNGEKGAYTVEHAIMS